MLNNFLDFDASDITSVIVGFTLALYGEPAAVWVRNKMDKKNRKIKLPTSKQTMGVVIVIVLLWTLWSTDETQKEIRDQARQTLLVAEAACEEQKLATQERTALQDLFLAALAVPQEIRDLPQDAPARIKWGQDLINKYLATFSHTNSERQRLAKEFAENPPTTTRCGSTAFSGK